MSSFNSCFLTCIPISQEVWYSLLLKNFPQFVLIHIVKGFGIVNKAEVDVFLELSCFFNDPTDVGNLISGSCAFSKSSLNIWKFMFKSMVNTIILQVIASPNLYSIFYLMMSFNEHLLIIMEIWVLCITKNISGRLLGKTLFIVIQKRIFCCSLSCYWTKGAQILMGKMRPLGTKYDGSPKCVPHLAQFREKSHFICYSW